VKRSTSVLLDLGRCWAVAAVVLLAVPPPTPPTFGLPTSTLVGVGAAFVLYGVLARGRFPQARLRDLRRRRLAAKVVFLTSRGVVEEAIWRGLLLGALLLALEPWRAIATSSVLFALAHWRTQRWGMLAHLATGTTFALVYVGSGSLVAAMAAHVTYNLIVATAVAADGRRAWAGAASTRGLAALSAVSGAGGPARKAERAPPAELRRVGKQYGPVQALSDVDLAVQAGEVVALLGPNGAGKTTAISILLGLRAPSSGSAALFGRDPRLPEARRSIGAMLQEVAFPLTLRVGELVDLVRAHYRAPAARDDLLERFGLRALTTRQAGGLSGGQRRRLAVALAFAGRPRLLFLDEPTAGLDVESRRSVWESVRAHVREGGTVLLTTHHLEEAEALATRIVVINRGRIVAGGTVSEIRARVGLTRVRFRAAGVPPLPGVKRHERAGDEHVLHTDDPDALVGELVRSETLFSALEIVPLSLEDAFLALTADDG
jgi:ABC-2 type transport system ATP-binding protein